MLCDFAFPGRGLLWWQSQPKEPNYTVLTETETLSGVSEAEFEAKFTSHSSHFFRLLDFYLLQQIYHVLDNFTFMAFLVLNLSKRAVPHPPLFYRKYHQGKKDKFPSFRSDFAAKS